MFLMSRRNLAVAAVSVLVLAAAGAGWAQVAAKTPKDAITNLAKSFEKGDKALFVATVDVAAADKELAGTMFDFLVAMQGLMKDAEKAYGKDAGIKGGPGFPTAEELAQLEIKEEGDKATATNPKEAGAEPMLLVKKGGNWLVDMGEEMPKGPEGAKMAQQMKDAVKSINDLRSKVGKAEMTAEKLGGEMMGIILKMAMADATSSATPPAPQSPGSPAMAESNAPTTQLAAEGAQTEGKDVEALWNDMIHFMGVARPEVAKTYAEAILKKPEAAGQLYLLASKTPGVMARLKRAAADKDLKPAVDQILSVIEQGYAAQRSDSARIGQAIQLLFGTGAEYENGAGRLEKSGEYAVPQLVQALRSPGLAEGMKDRVATFLPRLKLSGVRPLCEALQCKDLLVVQRVATALGQIGYPQAAPMLKAVLERPDLAAEAAGANVLTVRRAVQTALATCAGADAPKKRAAPLYLELAEQYYYQAESLRSGLDTGQGNVWFWDEQVGLSYKPIPAAIFCDAYAMRYARLALSMDQGLSAAVSLWLAADLKKEADLPASAKDPTVPADQPPAEYYSLAAGAKYLQEVLARGLKDKNVAVSVGAIEALARTAGAKSLVIPASGGSLPLVDAMGFQDGRVRFLAAVTLGSALPQERFVGWEQVVPTLNDAMRMTGGKRRAAMVGDGSDASNRVKGLLRAAGWDVLDAASAGAVLSAARGAGGADLVVIVNRDDAAAVVPQFRRDPSTSGAAVLVVGNESPALTQLAQADKAVKVLPAAASDEAITGAAAAKPTTPAGLSEEQAAQWAIRAAGVVRLLADTGNKVFEVPSSMGPLVELLNDKRAEVRLAAAAALAAMPAQQAQQAIARFALAPDLDEKVRVTALNTACASVRRFGNQFAPDQEKGVQDLVGGKGSAELRDAAAQLQGALSLSSEKVKGLILEASPK